MSSRFVIPKPCSKSWADLHGGGRERTCATCSSSVHAIERYSTEEWDQVWRESGGHVCGLLEGESPPDFRSRRAVLLGTILTAVSPLLAQSGRLRIRVVDAGDAVIPNADVSLLGPDDKAMRKAQTNAVGEVVFTDLPVGDSRFVIERLGFNKKPLTVTVLGSEERKIEAVLEVGSVGGFVIINAAPVKTVPAPSPTELPEPKRLKRRRWLIFR